MDRILLDSKVLAWVRYLPDLQILHLGLRAGQDYQYFDVPAHTYNALLLSQSKGQYYNLHIRNEFSFQKIHRAQAG